MAKVEFAAESLDDDGNQTGRFFQVDEVALIGSNGVELGRFTKASDLDKAVVGLEEYKIRGLRYEDGEPKEGLLAQWLCDEISIDGGDRWEGRSA